MHRAMRVLRIIALLSAAAAGVMPAIAQGRNACIVGEGGIGGTGAPNSEGGTGGTGVTAQGGTGGTGATADRGGTGGTGQQATGGIGGTGSTADNGGTGGTGIVGVVTGFASICVGGQEVHFDATTVIRTSGLRESLSTSVCTIAV